ncbi:T9SS type A sorting domain-containing protein, partial [bacterium]|nr:T9SS type A sorting domain-containing protein [bacterium]
RVSFGGVRSYFSWGELYQGPPACAFGQGMLFIKNYNDREYYTGRVWLRSWEEYLDLFAIDSKYDTVFYWETTLFGDPALLLPEIPGNPHRDPYPGISLTECDFGNRNGYAILNAREEIRVNIDSSFSSPRGRLYDLTNKRIVFSEEYSEATHSLELTDLIEGKQYLFILEDNYGKDDRVMFNWTNDPIIIDGSMNDWDTLEPFFGNAKTATYYDPLMFNLDSIWLGYDPDNWYIAFNICNANWGERGYGISFGYTDWGYTGIEGETTIPDDIYLAFDPDHPVWAILMLKYHPYSGTYCWWEETFHFWTEGGFTNSTSINSMGGDVTFSVPNSICEVKVPRTAFSYSDTIYLSLFSYRLERSEDDPEDTLFFPSQDVLPYHPELSATEKVAPEEAYTIHRFYKYYIGHAGVDPTASVSMPERLGLASYPNPFNTAATVNFDLPKPGKVKLAIYDLLGKERQLIDSNFHEAGRHTLKIQADGLSSGIYFLVLKTDHSTIQNKIILLK